MGIALSIVLLAHVFFSNVLIFQLKKDNKVLEDIIWDIRRQYYEEDEK